MNYKKIIIVILLLAFILYLLETNSREYKEKFESELESTPEQTETGTTTTGTTTTGTTITGTTTKEKLNNDSPIGLDKIKIIWNLFEKDTNGKLTENGKKEFSVFANFKESSFPPKTILLLNNINSGITYTDFEKNLYSIDKNNINNMIDYHKSKGDYFTKKLENNNYFFYPNNELGGFYLKFMVYKNIWDLLDKTNNNTLSSKGVKSFIYIYNLDTYTNLDNISETEISNFNNNFCKNSSLKLKAGMNKEDFLKLGVNQLDYKLYDSFIRIKDKLNKIKETVETKKSGDSNTNSTKIPLSTDETDETEEQNINNIETLFREGNNKKLKLKTMNYQFYYDELNNVISIENRSLNKYDEKYYIFTLVVHNPKTKMHQPVYSLKTFDGKYFTLNMKINENHTISKMEVSDTPYILELKFNNKTIEIISRSNYLLSIDNKGNLLSKSASSNSKNPNYETKVTPVFLKETIPTGTETATTGTETATTGTETATTGTPSGTGTATTGTPSGTGTATTGTGTATTGTPTPTGTITAALSGPTATTPSSTLFGSSTQEEINSFNKYDTDNSGDLSVNEFAKLFSNYSNVPSNYNQSNRREGITINYN